MGMKKDPPSFARMHLRQRADGRGRGRVSRAPAISPPRSLQFTPNRAHTRIQNVRAARTSNQRLRE